MGSYMNYKTFEQAQQNNDGDGSWAPNPLGNFTLARQPSVYSLTFEEFQNTLCGPGRDFGSMNMDELLRNIWTVEETRAVTTTAFSTSLGPEPIFNGPNLQRQGSLTLPRTLSQKTVDEVWRELSKESGGGTNKPNNEVKRDLPRKEPTLGEITLEEFLARAGVVREETQQAERPNNTGFFGELARENNNTNLAYGFHQRSQNDVVFGNNKISLNVGGVRSSLPQQPPALPPAQLPLFPKPSTVAFATMKSGLAPSEGLPAGAVGMVGLNTNGVTVAARPGVNPVSSGLIAKSSVDASSLSPVPYVFNRGRRRGDALERVVERRQRRMIKNRESAARSRARKQAYTLELEEEVAKLKEMNQELQKKQVEIIEMQRNQLSEKMKFRLGGKRQCLRRTLTGPW